MTARDAIWMNEAQSARPVNGIEGDDTEALAEAEAARLDREYGYEAWLKGAHNASGRPA